MWNLFIILNDTRAYYDTVDSDHTASQAPVITSHPPQDVYILERHKVTLDIAARGTEPLHYQWYYEDEIIHSMFNHTVFMLIMR